MAHDTVLSGYVRAYSQKIIVSKKWGFTKLDRPDYVEARAAGKIQQYVLFTLPLYTHLIPLFSDGAGVQFNLKKVCDQHTSCFALQLLTLSPQGPLTERRLTHLVSAGAV